MQITETIDPDDGFNDVKIVHIVSEHFEKPISHQVLTTEGIAMNRHPDHRMGVVDTACGLSVAGRRWRDDYYAFLGMLGFDKLVKKIPIREDLQVRRRRRSRDKRDLRVPRCLLREADDDENLRGP